MDLRNGSIENTQEKQTRRKSQNDWKNSTHFCLNGSMKIPNWVKGMMGPFVLSNLLSIIIFRWNWWQKMHQKH